MPQSVQCTSCKQSYQVRDELAGKRFKCKKCGAAVLIPEIELHAEPEFGMADLIDEIGPATSPAKPAQAKAAAPPRTENPYASPRAPALADRPKNRRYEDVPWSRRSSVNSVLVIVGWLLFPPLLWWCCYNLVTGDVYYNEMKDGKLKTWSNANKVVAAVLLLINTVALIRLLTNHGVLFD